MECNVGTSEKIIRLILGALFLWLGLEFNALFYIVAIVFFTTAAIGFCPLNRMLGINTCKEHTEATAEKKEEIPEEETPESTTEESE